MADLPPNKPSSDDQSVMRQLAVMSSVGIEFLATVLVPGGIGYWLDGHFGTRPWLLLVGGVFGFAVGLYRLLKSAADAMR